MLRLFTVCHGSLDQDLRRHVRRGRAHGRHGGRGRDRREPRSPAPNVAWTKPRRGRSSTRSGRAPRSLAVVADRPVEELQALAARLRVGSLQLHGNEPPAELVALAGLAYKAVRIATAADVIEARAFGGARLLADAKVPGTLGGTGHAFDWSLVAELARERNLVVAGGVTPDNVAAAVARLQAVRRGHGERRRGLDPRRKDRARSSGSWRRRGARRRRSGSTRTRAWTTSRDGTHDRHDSRRLLRGIRRSLRRRNARARFEELERAFEEHVKGASFQKRMARPARELRRSPHADLPRRSPGGGSRAAGRHARRALAQARGPLSHRRAQDQQRARSGLAREKARQAAHHRRDGRGSARRCHGQRGRHAGSAV